MHYLLALLVTLMSAPVAGAQPANPHTPADPQPAIRYLIEAVARSELSFERNSRRYTASEAAQHLQRKYAHLRDEIRTVDDFIELAASRSLVTGEPYLVVDSRGKSMPAGQWLRQVLAEHCGAAAPDTAAVQCPR